LKGHEFVTCVGKKRHSKDHADLRRQNASGGSFKSIADCHPNNWQEKDVKQLELSLFGNPKYQYQCANRKRTLKHCFD
jgi:hypothetical protein